MSFLTYTTRGHLGVILQEKINYIRHEGRKIYVSTFDGVIDFYDKMKRILPQLDSCFHLSHGSLAVNLSKIESFSDCGIKFINGDFVQIGIHNLRITRKKYTLYLERTLQIPMRTNNIDF